MATTAQTRVVHCKREPYTAYIGRPGPWRNPYVVGRDGTRDGVITKYEVWLRTQPELIARLPELRGQVLGCWCKPVGGFRGQLLCHGQILAGLADGVPPEEIE